jgi:hypothetical protein
MSLAGEAFPRVSQPAATVEQSVVLGKKEGGEMDEAIERKDKELYLRVLVFEDKAGTGVADPKEKGVNAHVELRDYASGEVIHAKDTETLDGRWIATFPVGEAPKLFYVEVRAIEKDCETLRPAGGPLLVQTGKCCAVGEISIAMIASLAEIVVDAVCGSTRIPNVPFALYPAGEPDSLIPQAATSATEPANFKCLKPGRYLIALQSSAPLQFEGETLELQQPCGGTQSVHLCAGQRLQIPFVFGARQYLVTGLVTACGKPLRGIELTLTDLTGKVVGKPSYTNDKGEYFFSGVPAGTFVVQAKMRSQDGRQWEPVESSPATQKITVQAGTNTSVPDFTLEPEIHKICGTVTSITDGAALVAVPIQVQDPSGNVLANVYTNEQGYYEWIAPAEGNYFIVPLDPQGKVADRFLTSVHSKARRDMKLHSGSGGSGGATPLTSLSDSRSPSSARQVVESVEDAVAYPVLTESVSFPIPSGGGSPGGGGGMGSAGASLGQTASRAVADVLGWKINAADPKGFLSALNTSFTCTEVEGHVECTWSPRTYAVQTDLGGGITGAQASLYSRAKEAMDQCMSLLDGLYPLDPDADPEYVTALREMAKSQMTEIVKEMGIVPPSILRVNTYFKILLGQEGISFHPNSTKMQFDPDRVGGTLGHLREIYGIKFDGNIFSNSVEDEQDITNFRIISDYMTGLLQSWLNNGKFFELGQKLPAFFGTQLVLISRQFSVIVETLNEVRFAMDSVFIGPSERQALLLKFDDPHRFPAMFFEDMLREIENLAADEGPRLLQDGGRISVNNNILPVARDLKDLVKQAHQPTNLPQLPDGYRTVRVRRSLHDLHDQMAELIRLAEQVGRRIPPPDEQQIEVLGIAPGSGATPVRTPPLALGIGTAVSIYGMGFIPGATVHCGSDVMPSSYTFYSAQRIDVTLTPSASGLHNVTVRNPGPDRPEATLVGGFTV